MKLPRWEPDIRDGWNLILPSGERIHFDETREGVEVVEALEEAGFKTPEVGYRCRECAAPFDDWDAVNEHLEETGHTGFQVSPA